MIQHDRRLGHRLRDGGELGQLVEVEPGIETETHLAETRNTTTELRHRKLAFARVVMPVLHRVVTTPVDAVAHTSKQSIAGGVVGEQHLFDGVAAREVGVGNDGADTGTARLAHRGGLASDEAGLADGSEVWQRIRVVAGRAFDEDRSGHVVRAFDIGAQLRGEIRAVRPVPQMVMGVDDGLARVDRFLRSKRNPIGSVIDRHAP